ncbi:MAG: FAD-dependent monooxygenase, partial [Rhizobiaceae bacterium]
GGIGMGVVRMIRPWNEWLAIWGYDIDEPEPEVTDDFAKETIRNLVGDQDLEIDVTSVSTWTVNNMYAKTLAKDRVFCAGDAIHRHPPSNGLGSNTSIQDSFNLAWKLAMVLKGKAGGKLLDSYQTERAPIARQIVSRANQSIDEFGPIFGALGLLDSIDPVTMQANMDARVDDTDAAEQQRKAVADAIAFKKYEFDAHGVEMNQRYNSDAVVSDGSDEPPFDEDAELHYQPTTFPGARLPHVWVFDDTGHKTSTLDLCGQGRFTILTGIGGNGWEDAAKTVGGELKIEIAVHMIGPRQRWQDFSGDWMRASEIRDGGCILVRPDQHVGWRAKAASQDAVGDLRKAMKRILALEAVLP